MNVSSVIRLSDPYTLAEHYENTGEIVLSIPFEVNTHKSFVSDDTEFDIIELTNGLHVIIKHLIDTDLYDYGVYENPGIPIGNRKDMIDAGFGILFEDTNCQYNDFEYARKIVSEDGEKYFAVSPTGVYKHEDWIALITEYKSEDKRLTIVEIGGEECNEGGLIFTYSGGLIRKEEVEL